eukprot:gene15520-17103_t
MAARSLTKLKLPRLPKKRPEDHGYLIKDPAIERWGKMRETTHLSFKLTPKTVFLGILWGVLVPGSFYYLLKWDLHRQDAKAGRLPREFP